jgi:ubiquitin
VLQSTAWFLEHAAKASKAATIAINLVRQAPQAIRDVTPSRQQFDAEVTNYESK